MAIDLDAGDNYSRTTGLPSITAFSMLGWARFAVAAAGYKSLFAFGGTGTSDWWYLRSEWNTTTINLKNSVGETTGSANPGASTWFHVALTVNGTGANAASVYVDGVQDFQMNGDTGVATGKIWVGADPWGSEAETMFAHVKIYNAVLTAAEIVQEMRSARPHRTANLNAWHPLWSTNDDQVDFSGNGNTWTVAGTPTTVDGPPVAWGPVSRRLRVPGDMVMPPHHENVVTTGHGYFW